MRIGLLSDTHIPEVRNSLPVEVIDTFHGVDLILHAGDIYIPSVLYDLEHIAPVLAASGDDDCDVGVLMDRRVKEKHVLELNGQILWLAHQRPFYLWFGSGWIKKQRKKNDYDNPNIVVFGHEHRPLVEQRDDILFINPGSPTFPDYHHGPGTVSILTIDQDQVDVRIIWLQH